MTLYIDEKIFLVLINILLLIINIIKNKTFEMDAEKDNQDGQVEDEQAVEGEETKKLSKNQKKKARLARKKEEQKQAENAEEPK